MKGEKKREKIEIYIFNARQRDDKKRPLKRGYLRAISCRRRRRSFVPPTLSPDGNKKKQLLTERRRTFPSDIPPPRFDRFSPVMFIQLGKRRTSKRYESTPFGYIPRSIFSTRLEKPTLNAIYRRPAFPFFVYSIATFYYCIP